MIAFNPVNLIKEVNDVQFWGIIGKNDGVLNALEMKEIASYHNNIELELWEDFPHNEMSIKNWNRFLQQMRIFLNSFENESA